MKKRSRHEEYDNHERWLLTYADLITLLLGLFVILYAMSKVDAGKYAEMISALSGVFGGPKPSVVTGNAGVVNTPAAMLRSEREHIEEELKRALQLNLPKGLVTITNDERGVTVHILEEMLFASGSAEFKLSSFAVLDSLAGVLKKLDNDLRVEGHTDDMPIHTPLFPSNWHLSVTRSMNAVYYLIEKHRIDPERVSVVGYSEYKPLVPNTSAENRARNRRVDIVIITGSTHDKKVSKNGQNARVQSTM
ncbi:MAG: OmpA family protein [Ignavibacteriales bacterium]|nr:OmpA family protein [Ignavibacteriales bacterium]